MKSELDLSNYTIILTGGTGFIGSFFLCRLRQLGNEVIELNRENNYSLRALPRGSGKKRTVIIHCAGAVPSKHSMEDCYDINRTLDTKMYTLSRKLNNPYFVYASTVSVYGPTPSESVKTISEEEGKIIINPYAQSKSEMEDTLLKDDYCRILRISSPYGKDNPRSPGLYGRFLNKRGNITIIDPYRLQNYVELNGLFAIMIFSLRNNYRVINAVGRRSITNLDLGMRMASENSSVVVKAPAVKKRHGFIYRSRYYTLKT